MSPGSNGKHRVVAELVLLDLGAQEAAGQGRRVHGHPREGRQHVRQAADVVLVGMGDEERLDLVPAFLEVRDVRDDEVDAEHLLVGEGEPAVDDDDRVAVLDDGQVLADLANATQRDDAQRLGGRRGRGGLSLAGHQKSRIWSVSGGMSVAMACTSMAAKSSRQGHAAVSASVCSGASPVVSIAALDGRFDQVGGDAARQRPDRRPWPRR